MIAQRAARSVRRVAARVVAIAFALGASDASALRIAEHPVGEREGARLVVVAPDEPGSYPMVVRFAAVPTPDAVAAEFVARGYVLCDARLATIDRPAIDDVMRFVAQRGESFGGDTERVQWLVEGAAVSAAMEWLARPPIGVLLRGVVLLDVPMASRFDIASPPPALIGFRAAQTDRAVAAERFAERWREAGGAVQVESMADGREAMASIAAWFQSLDVRRVARYETLRFSPVDAPAASNLVALDGALFAITGKQVSRRASAEAPWLLDLESKSTPQELATGRFSADASGQTIPGAVDVLLAVFSDKPTGAITARVRNDRNAWSEPVALHAGGSAFDIRWHRDRVTGGVGAFVASRAAMVERIVRTESLFEVQREAVAAKGAVASFVEADGILYAWVDGAQAGLYRRIDGTSPRWVSVHAIDTGKSPRLAAVPDPSGTGAESILLAFDGGRIERYDRSADRLETEIEIGAALRSLGHAGDIRFTAPIAAISHPVTGDRVQLFGVAGGKDAGYFFVRHEGRYRYGRTRDFDSAGESIATPLAFIESPFDIAGRSMFVVGRDTDGALRALQGSLPGAAMHAGFWWDRARPGEAFSLHPAGDQWMVTWFAYDAAGEPTWRLAIGDLNDGTFSADSNGLARYRAPGDKAAPTRDPDSPGNLSMQFVDAADSETCGKRVDRRDASALAAVRIEVDRTVETRCIEPVALGAAGRPSVDPTGFISVVGDRSFGVSIGAQGIDGTTREGAIVQYYDARGEPRWVMGTGSAWRGATSLELMHVTKPCRSCDPASARNEPVGTLTHRLRGDCGALTGHLSISIASETGALRRGEAPVQWLSDALCY